MNGSYSGTLPLLREATAASLAGATDVALVDFPLYENPGDSAIWAGTVQLLKRMRLRIVYSCTAESYHARDTRLAVGRQTALLIQGSGGFGDLYPRHQAVRERVVEDFASHRIVVMPQTVFFQDAERESASLKAFAAHQRLVVLARGNRSLEHLRGAGVRAALCPDPEAALRLRTQSPRGGRGVLFLIRSDKESIDRADLGTRSVGDWLDFGVTCGTVFRPRFGPIHLADALYRRSRGIRQGGLEFLRNFAFSRYASRAVDNAVQLISNYETVVTDRLHGVLLSLHLGKKVIAWDSGYGKLHDYVESFLFDEPRLTFVDSAAAVREVVERSCA